MRETKQPRVPNRPSGLLKDFTLKCLQERFAIFTPPAGKNMDADRIAYDQDVIASPDQGADGANQVERW